MPNNIERGIINQALMRIKLYDERILNFYLLYFDFILKNEANEHGKGTAIKNIPPLDVLKEFLIPLPPVDEQKRIINFLKEINSFIQNIENNENDVTMLIKQAKSKVLDLAIHGKLVPQDPNDEPASVLLEKIKTKKPTADISHYPFEVPERWGWCKLNDIANVSLGKTLDKQKNKGTFKTYLRSVNIRWGNIDLADLKEMKFEDAEIERYNISYEDLLICEGGEAGRCAVWKYDNISMRYQNAIHRVRFKNGIVSDFYMYVLWHYNNIGILEKYCKGVTIKHLTGQALALLYFPLPPLAEQQRIVSKIEQIFIRLEQIENAIYE